VQRLSTGEATIACVSRAALPATEKTVATKWIVWARGSSPVASYSQSDAGRNNGRFGLFAAKTAKPVLIQGINFGHKKASGRYCPGRQLTKVAAEQSWTDEVPGMRCECLEIPV
jgi:hypothetical protein